MTSYLSFYPEELWLDYFYAAVRDDVDRAAILKQLAGVKIARPKDWDPEWVRVTLREGVFFPLTADQCFCCLTGSRRLYWHHIIQVQHGGSNSPHNLVRLCHACHRRVHPWLEPPTSRESRSGWTSIRDLAAFAMDKIADAWAAGQTLRVTRRPPHEREDK